MNTIQRHKYVDRVRTYLVKSNGCAAPECIEEDRARPVRCFLLAEETTNYGKGIRR